MTERPILMSGPMVRAILEGRKTQTRRPLKRQHELTDRFFRSRPDWGSEVDYPVWYFMDGNSEVVASRGCPYGQPGDRLWVRETFSGVKGMTLGHCHIFYRADGENQNSHQDPLSYYEREDRWRPSIHMPRWACRLVLEVKKVRMERLQDITQADAIAEGCPADPSPGRSASVVFHDLWDSLNAKRGYGWDENPWVWVIEFEVVHD